MPRAGGGGKWVDFKKGGLEEWEGETHSDIRDWIRE